MQTSSLSMSPKAGTKNMIVLCVKMDFKQQEVCLRNIEVESAF